MGQDLAEKCLNAPRFVVREGFSLDVSCRACPACAVASPRSPPRSRVRRLPRARGDRRNPRGPPPGPRQVLTIVFTLAMTVLWAWLVTVVLDASNFPSPLHRLLHSARSPAPALLPSVVVVWVFVLMVLALTGRLWLSLGVVTAITVLLGAVNATKLELRNNPLVPERRGLPRSAGVPVRHGLQSKLVMGVRRAGGGRRPRLGLRLAGGRVSPPVCRAPVPSGT